MRYRKLDASGDYSFGRSQANFFVDVPDAPAQAAYTRLMLWQGEWFLDLTDGTPYNTRILGKYTGSTRDPVIRARLAGTQGVTAILAYASQVNRDTRAYAVQATIDTPYGASAPVTIPLTISQTGPQPIITPLGTSSGQTLGTSAGGTLGAQSK